MSCYSKIYKFLIITSILNLSQITVVPISVAQVSADQTVNTQVTPTANQLLITGGRLEGNNLFHSFNQFSIPNNIEAYFNNNNNINNIISRVTGQSISQIEGMIRANGTANLFLINPNGIIFGPNAGIDIGGSFLASSAESINFADGVQFSATNTEPNPILTVSTPVGLQFGSNPGTIINRANLFSIRPENTFALVGGDIHFSGGNLTTQGRIELGSVGSNSTVQITNDNMGFQLGYEGVEKFRDIVLSQASSISNSTNNSQIPGDVAINAKKFIVLDGAFVSTDTIGEGSGGGLEINASDSVEVIGTSPFNPSLLTTSTIGTGNGGDLVINTKHLRLEDGGQIVAGTADSPVFPLPGTGLGGSITINASESVTISGDGIVFIPSQNQELIVLSRISTESGFTDVGLLGFAQGGNINLNTNRLIVTNNGVISAESLGEGDAGNVNITANSIELDNRGVITASSQGTGNAGNLTIDTEQLTLNDRSQVAVRSVGTGEAGNLTLNAQFISLDGKSQLTATSEALDPETALELGLDPEVLELDNPLANAGSLTITTDNITINNDSEVTVSSFGLGDAGNINIQATDVLLDHSSRLSAETASGEGGNISLDVEGFLTLRRHSSISTTAGTTGGIGNGGNIDINALFLITVPTENSDIFANAFLGSGGNINIDAAGVFAIEERPTLTPLSDITASSQFGQVGNIGINRPDVDPQRSLVRLPDQLVDSSNLIIDACRPSGALSRGEFTITGRSGLPSNPNEGVDNPTGLTELGYPNTDSFNSLPSEPGTSSPSEASPNSSKTHTQSIVEAQGWTVNADGNVVLTAQVPTVTPHGPGLNPATCYDFSSRNLSP